VLQKRHRDLAQRSDNCRSSSEAGASRARSATQGAASPPRSAARLR
jgi:hypothetical protein